MTAKEYLSQAFTLRRIIKAKESRIQDLRDRQQQVSSVLTGIKIRSGARDKAAEVTASMLDLINECQNDIERLLCLQSEMESVINKVERSDLRLILYERYVNLKRWEDVAADNGFSWNTVHRKHSEALKKVDMESHTLDML